MSEVILRDTDKRRASGCLFGAAIGDAFAAETEFLSVASILEKFPPKGPTELRGYPARVTDDTQMMLAVGEALVACGEPWTEGRLEPLLRKGFIEWMESPENDRAPGNTCMAACIALMRAGPWQAATVPGSKGCGANMRVQPVGLLDVDVKTMAGLAQFQAGMTHGHPTGLAASDLTAMAIRMLREGTAAKKLVGALQDYAASQRTVYHEEWLGTLWQRPGEISREAFISRGWEECAAVLKRLEKAVERGDRESDPCMATGLGWIAEEALATGLLCFLLFADEPVQAVRRAAVTAGDSDSIACLAGSFAGAAHGMEAWPEEWVWRIEYRERLEALGACWDKFA